MDRALLQDVAGAYCAVLARLQAAVIELRAILGAEHEALVRRDALALDTATCAKADLLQRIEGLDAERRRALCAGGPVPARDAAAWQELARQLATCRQANEANGVLVARQLGFVRRALDILDGAGEGPPALYGPAGRAQPRRLARSLSRA